MTESAAFKAGLAPDDVLVAIDGRKFSDDVLSAALKAHKGGTTPLTIVFSDGDYMKTIAVDASSGAQYPHLVRVPGVPDVLKSVFAPKTYVPSPEPSVTP